MFCDFAATPSSVSEAERKFRIDDSVLKYLTVKLSDSISPEEISAAREEAVAKSVQQQEETAEESSEEDKAEDKVTEEKTE